MWKRSAHAPGPLARLGVEPIVRRVIRPLARDEVERRYRERKLPPIVLILVSLLLWIVIGWGGYALYQALT